MNRIAMCFEVEAMENVEVLEIELQIYYDCELCSEEISVYGETMCVYCQNDIDNTAWCKQCGSEIFDDGGDYCCFCWDEINEAEYEKETT